MRENVFVILSQFQSLCVESFILEQLVF